MMYFYSCYILCIPCGFIFAYVLLSKERVLGSGYSPVAYSHARGKERLLWALEDCLPVHSAIHFYFISFLGGFFLKHKNCKWFFFSVSFFSVCFPAALCVPYNFSAPSLLKKSSLALIQALKWLLNGLKVLLGNWFC